MSFIVVGDDFRSDAARQKTLAAELGLSGLPPKRRHIVSESWVVACCNAGRPLPADGHTLLLLSGDSTEFEVKLFKA